MITYSSPTFNNTIVQRWYYCSCKETIVGKADLLNEDVSCPSCGDMFQLTGTGQRLDWILLSRKNYE